jgi:hypothetical protein
MKINFIMKKYKNNLAVIIKSRTFALAIKESNIIALRNAMRRLVP